MASSLTFFPVTNGDMTLVRLDNGQTIIIDLNIRGAADDDDDDTPDVATDLRDRLKRDKQGSPVCGRLPAEPPRPGPHHRPA